MAHGSAYAFHAEHRVWRKSAGNQRYESELEPMPQWLGTVLLIAMASLPLSDWNSRTYLRGMKHPLPEWAGKTLKVSYIVLCLGGGIMLLMATGK